MVVGGKEQHFDLSRSLLFSELQASLDIFSNKLSFFQDRHTTSKWVCISRVIIRENKGLRIDMNMLVGWVYEDKESERVCEGKEFGWL